MIVSKERNITIEKTQDGFTTQIDLTPVEEITNTLDKLLRERKNFQDRRHIPYSVEILEKMEEMDSTQLRYLATNLVGLLFTYADLYQSTIDNPEEHLKIVNQYKGLQKICEELPHPKGFIL